MASSLRSPSKVLSAEPKSDGTKHYLVETLSTFQPLHGWYSKPVGRVLMHRIAYPNNDALKADYQPVKLYLENPLRVGSSWQWKGKGKMGVEIEESSRVTAAEKEGLAFPGGSDRMEIPTRTMNPAEGPRSDVPAALALLGLRDLPGNRQQLARLVAARHPASRPWKAAHSAAYRVLWRALKEEDSADFTRAA
jgi:hypothetical protein